jgi:hypothetical protein
VSLGKPVPIVRGSSGVLAPSPLLLPPAYRNSDVPASIGTAQAIAVVAPPGSVIAASGRPGPAAPVSRMPLEEEPEQPPGDQFASDRVLPSRPGPEGSSRTVVPVANWTNAFPTQEKPANTSAPSSSLEEAVTPPAPGPRGYVRAEYLLWQLKSDHAPPLVTTGSPSNPGVAGALGNLDTVQLFGGNLTHNPFSGGRFTAGYFLDDCGNKAIEVSGFFLAPRSRDFTASSGEFPVLTRPFFAVNPEFNIEVVQRTAFPGTLLGVVQVHAPTQLWGTEANLVCPCCCGCDYRLDVLAGPRYLNLKEGLTIVEQVQSLPGEPNLNGGRATVFDSFGTKNAFYGGQVGVQGRWTRGAFSVDATVKLALGVTHQEVDISGSQTIVNRNGSGQVEHFIGGLLALNSNIGDRSRDRFGFVPEAGVRLGYAVTDRLRLLVGYNFLYWNSVVRPGEQIDRGLDLTRIPNFPANFNPVTMMFVTPTPVNPPRPAPLFNTTDFWAQGLTLGVEFTF